MVERPTSPMASATVSTSMGSVPAADAMCSSMPWASRMLPSACSAMVTRASSLMVMCSWAATDCRRATMSSTLMRRKSYRWQRESTVTGTLASSVVARMKTTWGGGSSSVFSRALNALLESMWTSSMMKVLYRATAGVYRAFSMRSRILSTWVWVAASISKTSTALDAVMSSQMGHTLQGVQDMPTAQLMARARMRATEVFPTPRGPEKMNAWERRPSSMALQRTLVTCSCPTTSSNLMGLNFRAMTWYMEPSLR
ncbi:MAG: hypothetical protein BWX71_00791 [Deltaproteobacteria bacterium ADurb.Bin072]|nr:MAG: hypothetical protein BWX71_00791 [Deltaproteobacteria bacterium ADurb.Bin072]